MSATTLALAISSICALGFFFSLMGQQHRPPRKGPMPVIANVFTSLGAFGPDVLNDLCDQLGTWHLATIRLAGLTAQRIMTAIEKLQAEKPELWETVQ